MTFPSAAADAEEVRRYQTILDAVVAAPVRYPEARFNGRGIVICAGGATYFTCAWICIAMLRREGCDLAIELWYRGAAEMNATMLALMQGRGVTCVDAYAVAARYSVHRLDSWELKPFAIANSRFAEVLYLDADNVPIRDPTFLFESHEYAATGAVFWPDRYTGPGTGQEWLKRSAWAVCRVPYRVEPEIEAGQLLIDKRRCWHALTITLHLNEHSDFYYAHFYGDKDTFRLAWHRAGASYSLVSHPVANVGGSEVVVQHDFEGAPLFQHRSGDKWHVLRAPKVVPGFIAEAACSEILQDLRSRWCPPVRHLPSDFTPIERKAYEAICAAPMFRYALQGFGSRGLELRPDFTIGRGTGDMERYWAIEEDKDGMALLSLRSTEGPTCFLRQSGDGAWTGRWRSYDRARVRLKPGSRSHWRIGDAVGYYRMRRAAPCSLCVSPYWKTASRLLRNLIC